MILVPGAEETSSANAGLTRCNCGRLWNENKNDTLAPRAVRGGGCQNYSCGAHEVIGIGVMRPVLAFQNSP